MMTIEEEEELQYLRFFFQNADFGPAHSDVVQGINDDYIDQYGALPEGYAPEEE